MRKLVAAATAVVAAVLLATVVSAPAYAANASCTVWWFQTSCQTNSIPANSSGHWIRLRIEACDDASLAPSPYWRIIDAANGAVVGQGRMSPGTWRIATINGLYGSYYLRITEAGPVAYGNIINNDPGWGPDRSGTC